MLYTRGARAYDSGDHARAAVLLEAEGGSWLTVVSARRAQGRLDDAADAVRRIPESETGRFTQGNAGKLAYARGHTTGRIPCSGRTRACSTLASLRVAQGRLAEADSLLRENDPPAPAL